jgi:hypothetical protein
MARALDFLAGPVDAIRLDTFRVALTLSLLAFMGVWWQSADEWLSTRGFHVSWTGAGPLTPVIPPLPPAGLPAFGLLFFGGLALVLVGVWLHAATWLVLLGVTYVTLADPLTAFSLNRLYIVSYLALALAPGAGYWSLARGGATTVSAWPVRILQATLLLQYCTAGLCKVLHGDWLQDPYVLWTQAQGWYRTDLAALALRTLPKGSWAVMQYGALAFELLAPVLFGLRRLRPVAFLAGVVFQVSVALLMDRLIYFSLQLMSFYLLFLDDKQLHGLRRFASFRREARPASP